MLLVPPTTVEQLRRPPVTWTGARTALRTPFPFRRRGRRRRRRRSSMGSTSSETCFYAQVDFNVPMHCTSSRVFRTGNRQPVGRSVKHVALRRPTVYLMAPSSSSSQCFRSGATLKRVVATGFRVGVELCTNVLHQSERAKAVCLEEFFTRTRHASTRSQETDGSF